MADNLTPRQQEILEFIRSSLEVLGAPPTRTEICNAFGFASPNAAEDHLRALAKKGVPAFIVNRILMPMINEAVYTLYEGVGTVEAIDMAMRLGARHPAGRTARLAADRLGGGG